MSSASDHVKNIAIVGASGLVGGSIFKHVQETGKFNITVISREESTANFPSGVTVKKGDYSSTDFLESAVKGQDVLVLTFHVQTPPETQTKFIDAAIKTGVPWILPNEFGSDSDNEKLCDAVAYYKEKKAYRQQIDKSSTSSWIAIANGLWLDYSLKGGWFSVDVPNRKATLYDNGTTPFVTTSVAQVGRGVAKLLSLPVWSSSPSESSLSDYKDNFVFLRSFCVSQADILASVQRATGTTTADWEVGHRPLDEYLREGAEKSQKGDYRGMVQVLYGNAYRPGFADQYHGRELTNSKIGLEDENLDDVVARAVQEQKQGKDEGMSA